MSAPARWPIRQNLLMMKNIHELMMLMMPMMPMTTTMNRHPMT
jgi:hypothetical protein